MTQKFVMYSPLYRQEQELKRQGVELTRQTMSNWQLKASKLWLDPIYERLRNLLLKEEVIHADETTLTVLKTKDKPTPNKAYMWLYRTSACSNQNIVLYEHKPNRKIENAENFLQGFKGYIHAELVRKSLTVYCIKGPERKRCNFGQLCYTRSYCTSYGAEVCYGFAFIHTGTRAEPTGHYTDKANHV